MVAYGRAIVSTGGAGVTKDDLTAFREKSFAERSAL